MRDDVKAAIQAMYLGTRRENWYGKTYHEFWDWFERMDQQIIAMALDEQDAQEIREAITEVQGDADDAGFVVPDERMGDIISGGHQE